MALEFKISYKLFQGINDPGEVKPNNYPQWNGNQVPIQENPNINQGQPNTQANRPNAGLPNVNNGYLPNNGQGPPNPNNNGGNQIQIPQNIGK